jgi:magnesium chelatase family protein
MAERHARADARANDFLRRASASMALSARSHHRVLKVARTIADLEGCARVCEAHVAEALCYRSESRRP